MPDLVDWLIEHEPAFRKSRLPSLYSDLSVQRSTNPDGFAANVVAWQSALVRAAEAGKLPGDHRLTIQSSEALLDALATPQYGRPSGLGLVLDEAVKDGKMFDVKEFQDAAQSIYHRSWIPSPLTILRWGLKQAGLSGHASYDNSGRLRSGQLASVSALEDVYKQLKSVPAQRGSSLADRVITREEFEDQFGKLNGEPLSSQDVNILLRYLERDQGILSYDAETVKFIASSSEAPEPITTQDTSIASLKSLIAKMEIQIQDLGVKIASLQETVRKAVESKNRPLALSTLRQRKQTESILQQRSDTLAQLEPVYLKIVQAIDQVEIVETMSNSVEVLKGLNKKIGDVSRVEDMVHALSEEMDKVSEVGQVLQEPLSSEMIVDEVELDDELEELENEERKKEEEREAEVTRKRLAELEETTRKEKLEEEKRASDEEKLRNSIERLERMKIDEETKGETQKPTQQEQIPEQAS